MMKTKMSGFLLAHDADSVRNPIYNLHILLSRKSCRSLGFDLPCYMSVKYYMKSDLVLSNSVLI